MPNAHAQFTCKRTLHSFLQHFGRLVISCILVNPSSGASLPLRGISTNLAVLAKIYRDYAIMEAWLSFHDVTTVRNMYIPPIL